MSSTSQRGVGLALVVAWLAMSTAALGIVFAQPLHPLVIAVGRLSISTLAWAVLARNELLVLPRALRDVRGAVLLGGLVLAFHFGAWIWSLELTSIAHATVLVATQPIFAGLLARLSGDRAGVWLYVGTAVALGGTWLLAGASDADSGWLGDTLALAAALAAGVYLLIGRRAAGRVSLAAYMTTLNAIACVALLVAALGVGVEWRPASAGWQELAALLWLGLGPGFVGHGLMNWSARRVPVHLVSIAVLLEPVGATFLAWLAFGAGVSAREALGAALLLAGAGLGLLPRRS
ncbi:MAG: DMT family transporter [Planctomycetota bacterium]